LKKVALELCLGDDFKECFEDVVLEGGVEDDLAERFEDDVERFFEDDLDKGLDFLECLPAEVEDSETEPSRDWVVLVRL
jgi:hypothetical protein